MINKLIKFCILIFLVLQIYSFTEARSTLANQVSKNSVILDTVGNVTNDQGDVYANESIYVGGMAGHPSGDKDQRGFGDDYSLRELRSINGGFTVTQGEATVEIQVIPAVVQPQQNGLWRAALGTWEFKYDGTNNYKSVIHVQTAGYLDIAYQSTEMKMGEQDSIVHYGLSGNPHAVSLSKRRLKEAYFSKKSSTPLTPVLSYQPPNDIIIVQMGITPEGLYFRPIFDYTMGK